MKRGSDQATWIIVSLVIALIVMVVLISIFGSKTSEAFGRTTCEGQGYACVASAGDCAGIPLALECPSDRKVCCRPVSG